MTCRNRRSALLRQARFETFEERLALSAQGVADFYLTSQVEQRIEMHLEQLEQHIGDLQDLDNAPASEITHDAGQLEQHLGDVHDMTGVNYVHNTYGFAGAGQTVAVIDSGIAWDHVALGGGLGTGYRVVGGWDFAENDADPYDDGPSGFHGTHVAGIIGSSNATYRGVASDVDLVGLRVFDDNGAGYFSWVESALQWVHDHRNDFANPITTVNISLGTAWNSDSIPNWTTIENELAQLEQDGIFIAVSAGNSFADYNTPGLSYPAASPYVVPVASVTNAGSFSSFSQRHDRVIAAPGSSITSTVPDYVFGADGNPNDFGTASGTSMASPYVAGASVLVRQAMEFVGFQNITQDTIYDHIRNTADIFYDTATSASYHRLNVQAALDAIMPADDFGSVAANAHNLGTISGTTTVSGMIGTATDSDFFTFSTASAGTLNLTLSATDSLTPAVTLPDGSEVPYDGPISISVGDSGSYTISLSSASGIGSYELVLQLVATQGEGEASASVPSVHQLGTVGDGVAARDGATGTGFIMYSEESVFSRFAESPPHASASQHVIAVQYVNGQWFYDNNLTLQAFTPRATDVLLASVDFSADTVTSLQGTNDSYQAIARGFQDGDLQFVANQWRNAYNFGEFTVEGSYFSSFDNDNTVHELGAVGDGVAARDGATGTGFIMYSEESVFSRFAESPPHASASQHVIAVQYVNGQWFYDNNLTLQAFTPRATDILLASVDFSADTVTSLQGTNDSYQAIARGFQAGDLQFVANQWRDAYNFGEFTVEGSYFSSAANSNIVHELGTVGDGVAARDGATGTGFIMYSEESVFSRFAESPPHARASQHVIAVQYLNGQWFYDNNLTLQAFTPCATDVLLAAVDFSADTVTSLQGTNDSYQAIARGFQDGDLQFVANQWRNSYNFGEFTVEGSFFRCTSVSNSSVNTVAMPSQHDALSSAGASIGPALSALTLQQNSVGWSSIADRGNERPAADTAMKSATPSATIGQPNLSLRLNEATDRVGSRLAPRSALGAARPVEPSGFESELKSLDSIFDRLGVEPFADTPFSSASVD